MLNKLMGVLRSTARQAPAEPIPAPPALRMIVGGDTAPHLCMKPVDYDCHNRDVQPFLWREKRVTQLKADGIGAKYIGGRIVTMEGVPLNCALHCVPGLARLEEAIGHEMFIDGEYVAEHGFNATLAEQARGEGTGTFYIYDGFALGSWVAGGSDQRIESRLAFLRDRLKYADSNFVSMLDWWMLDGPETQAKLAELWALGYEGVVSKAVGSPYVRDRSPYWWRMKRVITQDLAIMDIVAKDGKLRAIMCKGPEGTTVKIGKGWSEEDGRRLIDMFDHSLAPWKAARIIEAAGLADMPLAEVSYQLTAGTTRSVRGAVFHRLRTDKGVRA